MEKPKRRWGDRKDGALIRDMDALHIAMANCYINRADNEAYISERIDLEPMNQWLAEHQYDDPEFKYTWFHLIVTALLRTLVLRPKLNRFICNRNYYQRYERKASFVVKRQMTEEAGEAMALVSAEDEDTLADIHEKIKKYVLPAKQGVNTKTEDSMDFFTKIPAFLTHWIFDIIRMMDRHGWLPSSLIEGESNYSSCFITNLGSIKLKCGYHHLSNWGTASIFVVIGEKKMSPRFDAEGNVTMHETLDIGLTIDERIADGYYYARSVKLMKYLLEHPALLEQPMITPVEF